ncbi:hypothetical protein CDL12_13198 [Handroanthus impetiginosus]|uniref:F-box domain-containing protein n=1 Tax=Handroanthus impetiginosus TaxID=429701 RepID=A0A2G9H9I3_9LAMI|nr:hypothetical protein CDL12_13198 [Handroanthus impetiginosus]
MDSKRSSFPRSAAIIGSNDDLLIEILLFLPAKSLVRFQSVSKHWRSLILSPRFSSLHTLHHRRRHKRRPSFLLRCSITSQFFVCHPNVKKLVPFRFKFRYLKILQSCNGLLLLECRSSPRGQKDYFICNPTTIKYRKLVLADETEDRVRGIFIVFFDPAKSPYYKAFMHRRRVYDSETRTWSEKVKISDIPRQIINGVHWNDAIYFIRPRVLPCYFPFEDDSYEIHWFNGIPRVRSPGAKKNHVMESNGHLHYVVLSLHPGKNQVYVFERDADFGSWFLMYEVSLNPISVTFAGNNIISLLGFLTRILRCWLILRQKVISRRDNCTFCLRMLISSSRLLLLFDLFLHPLRKTLGKDKSN